VRTLGERRAPLQIRGAARRRAGPDRRAWTESLLLVVVVRVVLVLVAYAAAWMMAPGTGPLEQGLFDMWVHWDGRHFLQVAEFGYTDPRTDPHATAFFPLYPLLIKAVGATGVSLAAAGMLISAVATVVACAYLYALADEELGAGAGRRAVLYLLLFPTAVFLVAPYSEALFLAGAVPAFYYARRGLWLHSALPAAVAVASRAAGIFLLAGLVFEFVRSHDFRRASMLRAAGALGVAVVPLIAYGAYLLSVKGDPLYFFVDQRAGWHRDFVGPIQAFVNTWELTSSTGSPTNWIVTWRLEIVAAAVGVGLVVWAAVKREWGYAVFMGTMMAALLTSTWYFSIPRMLLTLFPAVLLLAGATVNRPFRHELLLLIFAPITVLGVVVFTSGSWFY
jgi:Mannosyltransferase (PIG-V)